MNRQVRTEDEVVEIFAAANPAPVDRLGDIGLTPQPNGDRPPIAPNTPQEYLIMDPTRHSGDETPSAARRWLWVGGAAAATVAVVVGAALLVSSGDDDDDSATSATTAPESIPSPLTFDEQIAIAERVIAAFNDRDAAALSELVPTPDQAAVDFIGPDELAWWEAFDWRWEDAVCEPDARGVTCEMTGRNKLTELSGETVATLAQMRFDDERVSDLRIDQNFAGYMTSAFSPFYVWVASEHPTAHLQMWPAARTPDRAGAAELFERTLDEYVGAGGPQPTVVDFVAALADGDIDRQVSMLAPGADIDLMWATDVSELSALSVLFTAVEWDWEWSPNCSVWDREAAVTTLSCTSRLTANWVASDTSPQSGSVEFRMIEDGIAAIASQGLESNVSEALEPFWSWLRSEHPDDAQDLLIERSGITAPVLTSDAVERLVVRIGEYRAASLG